MITDDEVWRLFEQADIARGSDSSMLDAAGYLDELTLRSHDMTLIDTTETPTTPPGDNRWMRAGLAAAATALVVAGGIYLTRSDDGDVPSVQPTTVQSPTPTTAVDGVIADQVAVADTPTSAVALVRRYYDAIAGFDATTARSFLNGVPDMDHLEAALELDRQIGFVAELGECAATPRQDSTIAVSCWIEFEGLGSDQLGFEPFVGSSTELVVDDGKIVSLSEDFNWNSSGFYDHVFRPMADWVAATYPADLPVMYGLKDGDPVSFNATAESVPLWAQRMREYVDIRTGVERTATAFMEAFGALDADEASLYVAERASTERMLSENIDDYRDAIALYSAMGYVQQLDRCRHARASTSVYQVRCELAYHLMGSGDLGFEPFDGSFMTVTVDERSGLITEVTGTWATAEFVRDVGEPFLAWFDANHPDEVNVMSEDGSPRLTPESLALWRQRRLEYVQHVVSTAPTNTVA